MKQENRIGTRFEQVPVAILFPPDELRLFVDLLQKRIKFTGQPAELIITVDRQRLSRPRPGIEIELSHHILYRPGQATADPKAGQRESGHQGQDRTVNHQPGHAHRCHDFIEIGGRGDNPAIFGNALEDDDLPAVTGITRIFPDILHAAGTLAEHRPDKINGRFLLHEKINIAQLRVDQHHPLPVEQVRVAAFPETQGQNHLGKIIGIEQLGKLGAITRC